MTDKTFDAVLAQYEQNTKPFGDQPMMSQEDRMKRYFAAILPKGENSGQRRIRILPTTDGSSPFKEVWFHEIQVNGTYNKLYDPDKNEGGRSPLTEVYEELMKTGKQTDKDLAAQYKARKFYIVKVIDRDHEEDGVKFWRFKHNYKQDGILDKPFLFKHTANDAKASKPDTPDAPITFEFAMKEKFDAVPGNN